MVNCSKQNLFSTSTRSGGEPRNFRNYVQKILQTVVKTLTNTRPSIIFSFQRRQTKRIASSANTLCLVTKRTMWIWLFDWTELSLMLWIHSKSELISKATQLLLCPPDAISVWLSAADHLKRKRNVLVSGIATVRISTKASKSTSSCRSELSS